jgi:hypothetical protein
MLEVKQREAVLLLVLNRPEKRNSLHPDLIRELGLKLSELRLIDLRGNPIASLPAAIATLPLLEKLDLRWVEMLVLPPWIASLEQRGCLVYC